MSAFTTASSAMKKSNEFVKAEGSTISAITNDEKLSLYGLFKQATEGDNKAAAPWAIQLEAKAKWEAYEKNKGKAKDQAELEYAALAKSLLTKYGVPQLISW